jgi:L-asparaginase
MPAPRILVIGLGGTITMTRDASGTISPALSAADLVRAVPGIERIASIETASPLALPGASLSIDDVLGVAALVDDRREGGVDGAIVIQGTDTIEETAFLLDLVVRSERPVVVTGAMRGAQAAGADGPANILASVAVAASPQMRGLGTVVVLNDEIHAARFVQKSHTALPSAFASPAAGPLGHVIEGTPRLRVEPAKRIRPALELRAGDAPVALVRMGLGDDGRLLRQVPTLGYRGVVIEGMGAGHVPASIAPIVSDLVHATPVVLASRVHAGPVFTSTYGFAGSETDLLRRGAVAAGDLSGLKARLLLSLLLRSGADRATIEQAFSAYR